LKEQVSHTGFLHVRALLALGAMSVSALVGALFSNELGMLSASVGLVLGWRAPLWALLQEQNARKDELEGSLSEMVEVISLGLRSGLSFDQSFNLYHSHFKTHLAQRAAQAQKNWQLGLFTREEALRDLAKGYESPLFARLVESIIRCLRFGAPLAEALDALASEARAIRKASREEKVAKAPVKMLLPTAALILPAMLLMVLGPVLLSVMQGL
jgi:tight adherence protein C